MATSVAVLLAAVVLSVCIGGQPSSLVDAWHAVFTPTDTAMDVTIRELRWPRTVLAVVVGSGLGLAGILIQGHTRNPIADPGLLGINQGAALAIVAATALAGQVAPLTQALLAFAGAFLASVLVFLIGSASRHGATPVTLVLAGMAVTALCGGVVSGIVLLNEEALDTLRFWQVGSLAVRNDALAVVWPFIAVGAVLAVANIAALNALALGEDAAASLGVSLLRTRSIGIAAVTLLAGSAVTMAGPIAFAGLLVPHIARAIAGADYRLLIPVSALAGSTLLLVADTAGRVIARPGELSVGVVLAVVGAPFFVYIARRRKLVTL
jgi:iron complex transport system permease protein